MLIFLFVLLVGFCLGWMLAIHLLTKDINALTEVVKEQDQLIGELYDEVEYSYLHR